MIRRVLIVIALLITHLVAYAKGCIDGEHERADRP